MAPSPTGTAFCMACPRRRSKRAASETRQRPGGGERGIFAKRMAGHESGVLREFHALLGLERAQGGEADGHQGRLGVGGELQLRGIALEHQGRELLAERRVDLFEHRARRRKGVVESLAHADGLRALARKEKCDRHVQLCLVLRQIGCRQWRRLLAPVKAAHAKPGRFSAFRLILRNFPL